MVLGLNFWDIELKESQMAKLIELFTSGAKFPLEYVLALIALAAIGLAAFAIHAMHSIAKEKRDK